MWVIFYQDLLMGGFTGRETAESLKPVIKTDILILCGSVSPKNVSMVSLFKNDKPL